MTRWEQVGLGLILLIYTALACGYAWYTPPWNNPDEPAHYNYIRYVAERHELPELVAGDWDLALLSEAIPERFHPRFDVSGLRYEAHQPPLYYLISAPVYSLTSSSSLRARVLALRGVSILLGLALGAAVYMLAREVARPDPGVRILATATALLIPMSTATAASINNDTLAMVLATITMVLLARWMRGLRGQPADYRVAPSARTAAVLGAVIGMLVLTKLTVYVIAALAFGTVLVAAVAQRDFATRPLHVRQVGLVSLVAAAVAGSWFIRGGLVYGWGDILAQARHEAVVTGQPQYADLGPANCFYFLVTTFHSFFAQFGWMTIVVDDLTYWLYAAFALLAFVGLWHSRSWLRSSRMIALLVAVVLTVGQLLYYNLSFVQAQGRYLFPVIGLIALLVSYGWCRLAEEPLGAGIVLLWVSIAIATAAGGVGNWEIGPTTVAVLIGTVLVSFGGYWWLGTKQTAEGVGKVPDPTKKTNPSWWYCASRPTERQLLLTVLTVLALGALNVMCLTRYVIPFYRG